MMLEKASFGAAQKNRRKLRSLHDSYSLSLLPQVLRHWHILWIQLEDD